MSTKKSTERKVSAVQSTLRFKATKSGTTPIAKPAAVVQQIESVTPAPQPSKPVNTSPKKPAKKVVEVDSSSEEDEIEEPVDVEEKEETSSIEEVSTDIQAPVTKVEEKDKHTHIESKKLKELVKTRPFRDQLKSARDKVGGDPVGNAKKEHPALTILRVFDNDDEFGPCVGMSRLERWERASELGLEPPEIIREIIIASQDENDAKVGLGHSVFHDLVF